MGQPKALLRFKGKTFLEHVLDTVHDAGIATSIVVVGHHQKEIASALNLHNLVFNPDYEQGMGTSVQAGIRALPPGIESAGVFLVDHPLVDVETVKVLLSRATTNGIVLPVYEGRRGHPVFFGAELFAEILALPADRGLNTVVRKDPARVVEIPVVSPGVLRDIDTRAEFENLLHEDD